MQFELTKTLKVLLAINTVMFLMALSFQIITGEFQRFDLEFLSLTGALNTILIDNGEIWTFITSEYLHYDPIHFAMNMYALYFLGRLVSHFYTDKILFATYTYGALMASIFVYSFDKLAGDISSGVGASGALFAFLGLVVSGAVRHRRFGSSLPIDVRTFYPTLILAVIISLLPNVSLWAHLGGFFLGGVLGQVISPGITQSYSKREQSNIDLIFRISIFVTITSFLAFGVNFLNIFINGSI